MWETAVFFWGLLPQFAIPALPHPENHPACLFIIPCPPWCCKTKFTWPMFHSHGAQKLGRYVMEKKTLVSLLIHWLLEFPYNRLKVKVKVDQSCLTLCNPLGYTVHGILQARILAWVAFPFSRESSQPRDWTQVFCIASKLFTSWATGKPII